MGPYKIVKRIGKVAYDLELPMEMELVHPVFHVSILRKCIDGPSSIVPLDVVNAEENLTYEEIPVQILDQQVKRLRNKDVVLIWKPTC